MLGCDIIVDHHDNHVAGAKSNELIQIDIRSGAVFGCGDKQYRMLSVSVDDIGSQLINISILNILRGGAGEI